MNSVVLEAVERIVRSGTLGRNSKLPTLLRFIVDSELEGRGKFLNGYSIATDVLRRSSDFDPAVDSIVRVEMRRLRQALRLYYATEGKFDPVRVDIPKGGYRPIFDLQPREGVEDPSADDLNSGPPPAVHGKLAEAADRPVTEVTTRPSLISAGLGLILLFLAGLYFGMGWVKSNVKPQELPIDDIGRIRIMLDPISTSANEPMLEALSGGLQRQLLVELGSSRFMQVSRAPDAFGNASLAAARGSIHIRIHLQHSPTYVRAIIDLVSPSGVALWGNVYNVQWETPLALQDELTKLSIADLRPQVLAATRRLSDKIAKSGVSNLVWQSYLESTWSPANAPLTLEWEKQRIQVALKAIAANNNFGPAHAVVARKISQLALLDPAFREESKLDQAEKHVTRAMELSPDDPDAMFHIAVYYWYRGRFAEASSAFARVLELEPSNFLAQALAPTMPYACMVASADVITNLEKRDSELTPDNPSRWTLLTFISTLHANRGDWKQAEQLLRTAYFQHLGPDTFIPLATVLNQRGEQIEALLQLRMQENNWPNLDLNIYANQRMFQSCDAAVATQPMQSAYLELARLRKTKTAQRSK